MGRKITDRRLKCLAKLVLPQANYSRRSDHVGSAMWGELAAELIDSFRAPPHNKDHPQMGDVQEMIRRHLSSVLEEDAELAAARKSRRSRRGVYFTHVGLVRMCLEAANAA